MTVEVSLIATASYMPERVVENSFFNADKMQNVSPMFKGCELRHLASFEDTAAKMIKYAAQNLERKVGCVLSQEVDILITHVHFLDRAFTGCGAEVSYELGLNPQRIIDMHNGGCISFVMMMQLAAELMASQSYKTALICNVQNGAGRIFAHPKNRYKPQSAVPGDGCGVGLLVKGSRAPILSCVTRCYSQYASDMNLVSELGTLSGWWDPHADPLNIEFTEANIPKIIQRGNELVPQIAREAMIGAGVTSENIDCFMTNQPNLQFLEHWRDALSIPEKKHISTFREHGNLFGAALPILFERGTIDGRIKSGNKVLMAGFSHAGDYAAAAVVIAA